MKGPFSKYNQTLGGPSNYAQYARAQKWYRSDTVVHKEPHPYYSAKAEWLDPPTAYTDYPVTAAGVGYYAFAEGNWDARSNAIGNSIQGVHNKCYSKFVGKIRSGVVLGNMLVEQTQTRKMLYSAFKGLRNPLGVFANAFNRYARTQPKNIWRRLYNEVAIKDVPGAWLAFHFGVEPLIKDIYGLLAKYALPFKEPVYHCSSKGNWDFDKLTQPYPPWGLEERELWKAVVRLSAVIKLKNKLIAELADLGLINPLQPAWEVLPFSFVVDWFYPVSQAIASLSDFAGLEAADAYQTWMLEGTGAIRQTKSPYDQWRRSTVVKMERTLVVPTFKIQPFRFPQSVSSVRLATALAVGLGAFKPTLPYLKGSRLIVQP